jgi:hypothetical protein
MSIILLPYQNMLWPDFLYTEPQDEAPLTEQYISGLVSDTLAPSWTKKFNQKTKQMGAFPSTLGFDLNNAIDNDPDNYTLLTTISGISPGDTVVWHFNESDPRFPQWGSARGNRGLYIKSPSAFYETDATTRCLYKLTDDSETYISPLAVYGNGTLNTSGILTSPAVVSGISAQTVMVFGQDVTNSYWNFSVISLGEAPRAQAFSEIVYGVLINLPGNEFIDETNYNLPSKLDFSTVGKIQNLGYARGDSKRRFTIVYENCTYAELLNIRTVFKYSRGGLPILFMKTFGVDNPQSKTDSWVFGVIKTFSYTEPYINGFTVNITLEEN